MSIKKIAFATVSVLTISATIMGSAFADVLVNRGLPTANLNLTTGNRSNVAWTDGGQTAFNPSPTNYWVEGDTFTNTSSNIWNINTIRVWTVGSVNTASLIGGVSSAGAAGLSTVSTSFSSTPTTYADGSSYATTDGNSAPLTEIDFNVNLTLAAGQEYAFFLDGTGGSYVVPFMSASNAALSGSPQDGADNLLWEANIVNGSAVSVDSFTTLNNGWDKASDFNVQVLGTAVPEPGSMALMGLGLLGFAAARRRKA